MRRNGNDEQPLDSPIELYNEIVCKFRVANAPRCKRGLTRYFNHYPGLARVPARILGFTVSLLCEGSGNMGQPTR